MSDDDEAEARLDSYLAENDVSEGTHEDEASGPSTDQVDDSNLNKIKDALDRYTELETEKNPGGGIVPCCSAHHSRKFVYWHHCWFFGDVWRR